MSTIFTIGYEGAKIDEFLSTLQAEDIAVLVDVRALPLSRKKGFSKNSLRENLRGAGIEYLHLVDLGDPKQGRLAARAGRYAQFRKIFSSHMATAPAQAALKTLAAMVTESRICLMCFECDPSGCHRSIITEMLAKNGTQVINLFNDSRAADACGKCLPGGHTYQSGSARQ